MQLEVCITLHSLWDLPGMLHAWRSGKHASGWLLSIDRLAMWFLQTVACELADRSVLVEGMQVQGDDACLRNDRVCRPWQTDHQPCACRPPW